MADYITTFTGVHFNPVKPDKELLNIEDIAHSLSMQCRANGHYKTFFSVAAHCVVCAKEAVARGYSKRLVLACLLHDATEAYISDVPRPVKQKLKDYNSVEDNLSRVIYEYFLGSDLTEEEKMLVKHIDDTVLYHEFLSLMGEKLIYIDELKSNPEFVYTDIEKTKKEYVKIFNELTGRE